MVDMFTNFKKFWNKKKTVTTNIIERKSYLVNILWHGMNKTYKGKIPNLKKPNYSLSVDFIYKIKVFKNKSLGSWCKNLIV